MGRTIFGKPPAKEDFAARVAATDVPMKMRRFMRDLLDWQMKRRVGVYKKEGRRIEKKCAARGGQSEIRIGSASRIACGAVGERRWHARSRRFQGNWRRRRWN